MMSFFSVTVRNINKMKKYRKFFFQILFFNFFFLKIFEDVGKKHDGYVSLFFFNLDIILLASYVSWRTKKKLKKNDWKISEKNPSSLSFLEKI